MPLASSASVLAQVPGVPDLGPLMTLASIGWVFPIAAVIYFLLVWGKRSPDCPWKNDDQIGLKVIVAALIVFGTLLLASGLQGLLHLLLTFKQFGARIKDILPDLLVGLAVLGGTLLFGVPRTNHEQYPKALRLTAGMIALVSTISVVAGLDQFITTIFKWPSWSDVAGALTTLLTSVIIAGASGYFFARLSGLAVPEIPIPQQAGQQPGFSAPPGQTGFVAQPTGYPQQQQPTGYPQPQQPTGYPTQGQGGYATQPTQYSPGGQQPPQR